MKRVLIPVLAVLFVLAAALAVTVVLRARSADAAAAETAAALRSGLAEEEAKNDGLRTELNAAQTELAAAQTELAAAQAESAALREENAALTDDLRERTEEAEALSAKLAEPPLSEQILAKCSISERSQATANVKEFNYLLYDPGVRTGEALPLIVFLHGSGGCYDIYADNTIPTMLKRGWLAPNAVVLMPHCPGTNWEPYSADVMELIETVVAAYGIDRNRISVTGFSLGGVGCFCMMVDYPDYFAAAMPLAAKCFPEKCAVITSTPVRILHGEKDLTMDPTSVIEAEKVINEAGGSCTLTFFPGEEHLIQQHYLDDCGEPIEWLLAQKRTDKQI